MEGGVVHLPQLASGLIHPRVEVHFEVPAEQDAERLEDAAVEVAVVLFVKDHRQRVGAHDDAHALFGVLGEELHKLEVLLVVRDEHGLADRAQNIGTVEKILFIDVALCRKVVKCNLKEHLDVILFDTCLLPELLQPFSDHVDADLGDRSEGAADGENVLLVQDIGCLAVSPVGGEDDRIRHAVFDQLKREQAVVDFFKIGPVHLDHVDFHLIAVEVVVQRLQELLRLFVEEDAPVNEVDAEQANGLVLQQGIALVQTRVKDDFVGFLVGSRLELEAEPAVALVGLVVIDGRDRIREGEEMLGGVFCAVQAIHHQLVFVGEHLVHAAFADVPAVFFFPVDGIRKILVIG